MKQPNKYVGIYAQIAIDIFVVEDSCGVMARLIDTETTFVCIGVREL